VRTIIISDNSAWSALTSDAVQISECVFKLSLRIIFRKHTTQLRHQRIKSAPLINKPIVQRRMVLPTRIACIIYAHIT